MESEILAILLEIAVFIVILFFTIQTIPAIPAHIITQLQKRTQTPGGLLQQSARDSCPGPIRGLNGALTRKAKKWKYQIPRDIGCVETAW